MKIDPVHKKVFDKIFEENLWRDSDSRSGPGSNFSQTEVLRKTLPGFLKKYNVKSVLDVPCGDFNWMKEIKNELAEVVDYYIGGDIISEIIVSNNLAYGDAKFSFQELDLTVSDLPTVDLILCRDCLVHLPYPDIYRALKSMKKSGSTYLLTTSFTSEFRKNKNILIGGWRPLNFQKMPFYFPATADVIIENCTENGGIYQDKSLVLWQISTLSLTFFYLYLIYRKIRKNILRTLLKYRRNKIVL